MYIFTKKINSLTNTPNTSRVSTNSPGVLPISDEITPVYSFFKSSNN